MQQNDGMKLDSNGSNYVLRHARLLAWLAEELSEVHRSEVGSCEEVEELFDALGVLLLVIRSTYESEADLGFHMSLESWTERQTMRDPKRRQLTDAVRTAVLMANFVLDQDLDYIIEQKRLRDRMKGRS